MFFFLKMFKVNETLSVIEDTLNDIFNILFKKKKRQIAAVHWIPIHQTDLILHQNKLIHVCTSILHVQLEEPFYHNTVLNVGRSKTYFIIAFYEQFDVYTLKILFPNEIRLSSLFKCFSYIRDLPLRRGIFIKQKIVSKFYFYKN